MYLYFFIRFRVLLGTFVCEVSIPRKKGTCSLKLHVYASGDQIIFNRNYIQ